MDTFETRLSYARLLWARALLPMCIDKTAKMDMYLNQMIYTRTLMIADIQFVHNPKKVAEYMECIALLADSITLRCTLLGLRPIKLDDCA